MKVSNCDFGVRTARFQRAASGAVGSGVKSIVPVGDRRVCGQGQQNLVALHWACWTLLAMALLLAPRVWAAESNNELKLAVTATVLKHASLQVLAQPGSIVLTAADIAQGYVDVASPAQVAVTSNTQGGYMLMFDSHGEFFRQTLVKGLNTDVQLSASGGGVAQRPSGRGMSKTLLDLEFRFLLSDSARQGVYPWPLRLSVTPI